MVARANQVLRYDPDEASRNRTAAWAIGENCAQSADPVSANLVARSAARCSHRHIGQCHRAADEMVGAPQPFCRWRAANSGDWRSANMTCYIAYNLSGPDHAECARVCIRNGLPVGIKAQDGKVYLLSGEPGHSVNAELADYAAKTVTIKGRQSVRDGFAQLQVEEIRKL